MKLQQQYIKLRATSLGTVLQEFQGTIDQGQLLKVGTFIVDATAGVLNIADTWPGSTLKLQITDPSGATAAGNAVGVSDASTATSENVLIDHPKPGSWAVSVQGVQVASQGEPYYVLVSTRHNANPVPDPNPPAPPQQSAPPSVRGSSGTAGAVALTLVVMLAIIGLAIIVATRRRTEDLALLAAGDIRLALRRGAQVLGRDPACDLLFSDEQISRRHAQIVVERGGVYIQDLGSTTGTFVNGMQVAQAPLARGDRLRLGNTELLLWDAREA